MEGVDLVNVALGALINLAEHAPVHRARFTTVALPGGRRLLPLLCRVLQARLRLPRSQRVPFASGCCRRVPDVCELFPASWSLRPGVRGLMPLDAGCGSTHPATENCHR